MLGKRDDRLKVRITSKGANMSMRMNFSKDLVYVSSLRV